MKNDSRLPLIPAPARFWKLWTIAWTAVAVIGLVRWVERREVRAASLNLIPVASDRSRTSSSETKNIEDVKPGDFVMARDDRTGEVSPRRVTRVFRNMADHLRIVGVRSESEPEQEVSTTDEHPFFVVGRGWVAAKDLAAGDRLLRPDGGESSVVTTARAARPEGVEVYNFEVEGSHTYYVAQHIAASFILVHNSCEDKVYRGLAKGEDISQGLKSRSPGTTVEPYSHSAGKKDSPWISTTKDPSIALNKYGKNGVVEIDLSKVQSEILDVSGGYAKRGRGSSYAKSDKEVLIRDFIPPEALKPYTGN